MNSRRPSKHLCSVEKAFPCSLTHLMQSSVWLTSLNTKQKTPHHVKSSRLLLTISFIISFLTFKDSYYHKIHKTTRVFHRHLQNSEKNSSKHYSRLNTISAKTKETGSVSCYLQSIFIFKML